MFILIPYGQEDFELRRLPVVSIAIAGLCLLAFGLTWPAFEKEMERRATQARQEMSGILGELGALVSQKEGEEFGLFRPRWAYYQFDRFTPLEDCFTAMEEAFQDCRQRKIPESDLAPLWARLEKIKSSLITDTVLDRWGLVSARLKPHALFSHMFIHAGYWHLIGNMLFFGLVGMTIEDIWGRGTFLTVYLLSGLAAAFSHILVEGVSEGPMVGASGAIAGLMGAFLVTCPTVRIKMLLIIFLGGFHARSFPAPAWVFFPFWIFWEIFQGLMSLGATQGGGVAHWAHIGGFFFGAAAAAALKLSGWDKKLFPLYAVQADGRETLVTDQRFNFMRDPGYHRAVEFRVGGEWDRAAAEFRDLAGRFPGLPGPWLEEAEVWRLAGRPPQRQEALLRGLEAARRVKNLYPEIKVLILSMHRSKEYLLQAMGAGVDGYVLKEDADTALHTAIQEIRRGKNYYSPLLWDN